MRLLAAAIAVLVVAACSGGVGIAGTVPPPPGTLPPDPSGLTATATVPPATEPASSVPASSVTPAPTPSAPAIPIATPNPTATMPPRTPRPTPIPTPVGATPTPPPTATPAPQTSPPADTIVVTNYLLLDSGQGTRMVPVQRTVAHVPAVGGATLRALLAGPLPAERDAGIVSAIPTSVILLGLTIQGGLATVDLSTEFAGAGSQSDLQARVAQVLYTLTQFSTVIRVAFTVDGAPVDVPDGDGRSLTRPVGRDDYLALLPPVFVDSPRWGESISSPIQLVGRANVFEGTFRVELRDATGATLTKRTVLLYWKTVNATCGTGCWGDFNETVRYQVDHAQTGQLVVYTLSAKDGSVENPRTYAVQLLPAGSQ